jgi:hypothetical protein
MDMKNIFSFQMKEHTWGVKFEVFMVAAMKIAVFFS